MPRLNSQCEGTSMTSVMELLWMRRATITLSEGETFWLTLICFCWLWHSSLFSLPLLGQGTSTIMRKPMLMGGAAIPGWGLNLSDYLIFFQISFSLPENLSGVICLVLFFLGGSFFIDLSPRCHTSWSSPQAEKLFSVASLVTRREIMLVREQCLTK